MIQATELRIGNWMMTDNSEYWTREYRHTYTEVYIDVLIGIDTKTNLHYAPIPLTPEILEKAGFAFSGALTGHYIEIKDNRFQYKDMAIAYNNDTSEAQYYVFFRQGNADEPRENDAMVCLTKHLKYLHQLQNLFYSITGSELQIEL